MPVSKLPIFVMTGDKTVDLPYKPDAGSYTAEGEIKNVDDGKKEVIVTHTLKGSNLVRRMFEKGCVSFAASIGTRSTVLRDIHVHNYNENDRIENEIIEIKQSVSIDDSRIFGYVYCRGMIIANEEIKTKVQKEDKLSEVLDGADLIYRAGSFLALAIMHPLNAGGKEHLISNLIKNDKLPDGAIEIGVERNSEDIKFHLEVSTKLYNQLNNVQSTEQKEHANSIYSQAICGILYQLKAMRDEDPKWWEKYRILVELNKMIRSIDLKSWHEDEFKPEKVASYLVRHNIPGNSN